MNLGCIYLNKYISKHLNGEIQTVLNVDAAFVHLERQRKYHTWL